MTPGIEYFDMSNLKFPIIVNKKWPEAFRGKKVYL